MTLDEILLKHGAERVDLGSARHSPTWVIKHPDNQERFLTTIALLGATFVPKLEREDPSDLRPGPTVLWPRWEAPSGRHVAKYDGPERFLVYERGFRELLHADIVSQLIKETG